MSERTLPHFRRCSLGLSRPLLLGQRDELGGAHVERAGNRNDLGQVRVVLSVLDAFDQAGIEPRALPQLRGREVAAFAFGA